MVPGISRKQRLRAKVGPLYVDLIKAFLFSLVLLGISYWTDWKGTWNEIRGFVSDFIAGSCLFRYFSLKGTASDKGLGYYVVVVTIAAVVVNVALFGIERLLGS